MRGRRQLLALLERWDSSEGPIAISDLVASLDALTIGRADLSDVIGDSHERLTLTAGEGEQDLRVPGSLEPATALELEERLWQHMHFASHLRSERLGEFTLGTNLLRSDSLAIVQLLVLYHLVTAQAKVEAGGPEAATRL